MLLVPKQLQRAGMTGAVPYYGGRFSPAQAYAASHPTAPPPSFAGSHHGGRSLRAGARSVPSRPILQQRRSQRHRAVRCNTC